MRPSQKKRRRRVRIGSTRAVNEFVFAFFDTHLVTFFLAVARPQRSAVPPPEGEENDSITQKEEEEMEGKSTTTQKKGGGAFTASSFWVAVPFYLFCGWRCIPHLVSVGGAFLLLLLLWAGAAFLLFVVVLSIFEQKRSQVTYLFYFNSMTASD